MGESGEVLHPDETIQLSGCAEKRRRDFDLVGEARDIRVPGERIAGPLVLDDDFLVTALLLPDRGLSLAQEGLSQQYVPC